jgi:hypothetical protein
LDLSIEVRLLEMLATSTDEDLEEAPDDEVVDQVAPETELIESDVANSLTTEVDGDQDLALQESNSVADLAEGLDPKSDGAM